MTSIPSAVLQKITRYYERTLNRLTKENCRTFATAFINNIEPDKHHAYPYSSGRPPWWPPNLEHINPGCLRKELLIQLLLHIIRKPVCEAVNAEALKAVAESTGEKGEPLRIIFEALNLRKLEELYEGRESNVVIQFGYCDANSGSDKSDDRFAPLNTGEAFNGNPQMIPLSPCEQAITSIPIRLPHFLQGSFRTFRVQSEFPPHKVTDSTLFSASYDQIYPELGITSRDVLFDAVKSILKEFFTVMVSKTNRSPGKLADIYKFIVGAITPTETQEIWRHWMLAIESDISRQEFQNWSLREDAQDPLLFVLYGSHSLTLGKLDIFLELSSVSESTKRTLKKIIILRKLQLEAIHQRKSDSSSASATGYHKRRFTCGTCYKKFKDSWGLREHSRTHTGERPYRCSDTSCTRTFAHRSAKCRHERKSHPEIGENSASATGYPKRRFTCATCDKKFQRSSSLREHLRTHTGERPYRCSDTSCTKAFAHRSNKNRHERKCHPEIEES